MTAVLWVLGSLGLLTLAAHMFRPNVEPRWLSAAQFFGKLHPPKTRIPRWRVANPFKSPLLWVQLLVLALLFYAVYSVYVTQLVPSGVGVGVWLLVDTSASMGVPDRFGTRLDAARNQAALLADRLRIASQDGPVCLQVDAFDLERRNLQTATQEIGAIHRSLQTLDARPLGTDLGLALSGRNLVSQGINTGCAITHLVVISDQPAPVWAAETGAVEVIWLSVGKPVDNTGLTQIRAVQNALTGLVDKVEVRLQSYGSGRPNVIVKITKPSGDRLEDSPVAWSVDGSARVTFSPDPPGLWQIEVSPTGAYSWDDRAGLEILPEERVLVDWQLPNPEWAATLGWQLESNRPHLRVVPVGWPLDDIPTLVVGEGYSGSNSVQEIQDFKESHPLLNDLNFDVVETLPLPSGPLLEGFEAVLRGADGGIWIAERKDPPAVYIPGMLLSSDDNLGRFSTIVFFNGVRFLLGRRVPPPLYTLTTPLELTIEGSRTALHSGEGDTAQLANGFGSLDQIMPRQQPATKEPVWPFWLVLAMVVFCVGLTLSLIGGERWI